MFLVYHSNSIELFMRLVISIMSNNPISNPMKSEIILIDNKIVERWIEIEISNYFGVSANIKFMSVELFIQKILENTLSVDLNINNFSYNSMYWKFMDIFYKLYASKDCEVIQKYLNNDIHCRKCSQLSIHVANLFLKYLIYRSDWLNSWQAHKIIDNLDIEHQKWQSIIWRMFISQHTQCILGEFNPFNRYVMLLEQTIMRIQNNNLPNRIFIYSIVSLPPIYWKILNLLSYHIDIYLWFINPCVNNWDHVSNALLFKKNQKKNIFYSDNQKKKSISSKKYDLSLLNLWGDFGQDTLCLLNKLENTFIIKAFKIPTANSMLHVLQRDILNSYTSSEKKCNVKINQFNFRSNMINKNRYIIKPDDQSITVHQCYHVHREIEILHNNLLLILSNDPTLSLGDIVVMAPNINDYIASIKNVFNNIFHRKLSFTISDNYEYDTHPIILSIFKILNICNSRCTSEEIISFLSISSIIVKFHINPEEVKLIRTWIIKSGIRWGLDEETMKIFDLPITKKNTWSFGLHRMLLGYAMREQHKLWKDIYPYDCINEEYINTITKLGNFFYILKKWRDRLNCDYVLKKWISCIQEIINDFFDCTCLSEADNKILFLLKTYWLDIIKSGIQSGYKKKVNVIILFDQLKFKLNKKRLNCQFLPNVINFCNITPICFIPCKILCIIGMNHDDFPRYSPACDFDLMLKNERIGDNNIFKKDYYTFLLMCLLPKERIYISFINKITYYSKLTENASTLIEELLEYLANNFYLIKNKNLNVIDNMKYLREYLFQRYSYFPFDLNNFVVDAKIQNFSKEWMHAVKMNYMSTNNLMNSDNFIKLFSDNLDTVILFKDLYNFYKHPIRTWFQRRLGVYFYLNKYNKLINDEPFTVDSMHRFRLNMKLINYMICNQNIDELYEESYAIGIIPSGSFGRLYWIEQYEQMSKLINQIKMYYSDEVYKLDIDLMFDKIRLQGQLNIVQKNGLIRWKASYLSMKDCFLLWLEHLTYCAAGGNGSSRLFGINSTWCFPNFSKSLAKNLLFTLIKGYYEGMQKPLMLLYRSGGIWINSIFDWNHKIICSDTIRQQIALQRLIQTWQGYGSDLSTGEHCDPYLRKIIPYHLNKENIVKITTTAQHYFLNVMQHRVL